MNSNQNDDENQNNNSKKDELPAIYRYFLYFEISTIVLFLPIILCQVFLAFDFFMYINKQTNMYHYFFVTERIVPGYYPADFIPAQKDVNPAYIDQYISNCAHGYAFNNFLRLFYIFNTYPIDESHSVKMMDPDFNNTVLNLEARGLTFWKFDISKVNPDKTKWVTIPLSTGINFIEWKGKRYCQKRIYFDAMFKLLQVIQGKYDCASTYPMYQADDCGTYYNNTYRICVLRNLARDNKKNNFADNKTMLEGTDNICPLTNLEFIDNPDPSKVQIVPTIKNLPNIRTGKQDNKYSAVMTDMVTFQNFVTNTTADYNMEKYYGGTYMYLSDNFDFGMMDDNNVLIDKDSFIAFYNYTTADYIYYQYYLNSTSGVNFYRPFDPTNSIQAQLGLFVLRAIRQDCFNKVYLPRKETDLLGLPDELNVRDFFIYSLTILIWTIASIFLGVYNLVNIRLKIIMMKLKGTLNLNNKMAEEISKWTNMMFWFIIFMVKILIVGIMVSTVTNQIQIVTDMMDYKCYIQQVRAVLNTFTTFLKTSKTKLMYVLFLLIFEIFQESLVTGGYLIIWTQNMKKDVQNKKAMKRLREEREEKEKLLAEKEKIS